MSLFGSADLLSDFKFMANRSANDASLDDAQIYRLLTLGQQAVVSDVAAVFPRVMMGAPVAMTTVDGGTTWQLPGLDDDGEVITPFGHAEVYATSPNGAELYGSSYAGWSGDFVFEGRFLRVPAGQTRQFTNGPYMRYVAMPGHLNAATAPTLSPPNLRPLIVYRALEMWANRGGTRDPRPYQELYAQAWSGKGLPGSAGLLGLLHTQYRNGYDAAMQGVGWWRAYVAAGGSGGVMAGDEA
jgi:hypothetical protein